MAPEERMLERFTRERQRTSKGDVFNLEDEEELTHYGQSLSKLDDFDNIGLDFGYEEEEGVSNPNGWYNRLTGSGEAMDRRTVEKNHFGGFEDEDEDDDSDGEEVCLIQVPYIFTSSFPYSPKEKSLRPRWWQRLSPKVRSIRLFTPFLHPVKY